MVLDGAAYMVTYAKSYLMLASISFMWLLVPFPASTICNLQWSHKRYIKILRSIGRECNMVNIKIFYYFINICFHGASNFFVEFCSNTTEAWSSMRQLCVTKGQRCEQLQPRSAMCLRIMIKTKEHIDIFDEFG